MPAERAVVVTGASTGIGRACALHMDRLGWRVFAGVRNEADAQSLRLEASDRLTPLFLDVAEIQSLKEGQQAVAHAVGEQGLAGLINNAGIAYGGPVEFLDLNEVRRTFEVNFFGVIAATQAFLPLLRQGRGRIVNMSSISGLTASPFLSPYSTSKFALEALSDSLRVELHPWKIEVSVIEPGAINTPIWNKGLDTVSDLLNGTPKVGIKMYGAVMRAIGDRIAPHGIAAQQVAEAAAHALSSRRPRTRYVIGLDGSFVQLFRRLPDRVRDWLILSRLPKWG